MRSLLFFCVCVATISCKKDPTPDAPTTVVMPPVNNDTKNTVSGVVVNENGAIVAGAMVVVGTKSTLSDATGKFAISNVTAVDNRLVAVATKTGYFKQTVAALPSALGNAYFSILLATRATPAATVTNSGGSSSDGVTNIVFPAAAFVVASSNAPYAGMVKVFMQTLDPTLSSFMRMMPGPHVSCNITRIDAVGGFIEGTFQGTFMELTNNTNKVISGSFRVPRTN